MLVIQLSSSHFFSYLFTQVYFHCDQLMRGMHAVYLERWLRYFPRESMLIIKAEDMFRSVGVNQQGCARTSYMHTHRLESQHRVTPDPHFLRDINSTLVRPADV